MPEDLSASSFCKDHFCKNDIDPKYVYHPYQVYHGTASTLGTRTFQSVSLLFFNAVGGCPVFGH